jgi:zinc protease
VENRKKTIILLSAILVVLLSMPFAADALDMRKDSLAGGLTVIHVERHELPIVSATLLIKASPLQEDKDRAGTAHMTAKMLLEGTAKRKATDISHQMDFIGGSLETSVNDDFTTVSLSVLKKDIETGFDILSDILLHPSFSDGELIRRKTLLTGYLKKMEEAPSYIAGREFQKRVFGDFSYGRQVTGDVESISGISRFDLVKFHETWYRPDNSILVVVGDLGRDELAGLIRKYLASWKATGKKPASKVSAQFASSKNIKPRKEIIDMDVSQANIMMGHSGIARSNPDYYSVQIMNYVLGGGGFASRLMKIIRGEKGLTYSIYSSFYANRHPGRFEIGVQTKNEAAGIVIKETIEQIRRIRTEGVTDEELRDAKDFLVGSFPRRIETGQKVAGFLTAMEFYELGDDYIEKYRDYILKVTKEDVLKAAGKYLNEEDMIIVVVGNKKKLKL